MLTKLAKMWREGGVMREAVKILAQMVADTEYIFGRSWEVCQGTVAAEELRAVLKDRDKSVNRGERHVRRLLLEHLAINPGEDAAGCLAVMVMAKDVERIGDHGCRIFELAANASVQVRQFRFYDGMAEFAARLANQFPCLQKAVLESSEQVSRGILAGYQELKVQGKTLEAQLFRAGLQGEEAVVTTLMLRCMLRVNAHMGNVASGIIFPLENIDFVTRGLREEEKGKQRG